MTLNLNQLDRANKFNGAIIEIVLEYMSTRSTISLRRIS